MQWYNEVVKCTFIDAKKSKTAVTAVSTLCKREPPDGVVQGGAISRHLPVQDTKQGKKTQVTVDNKQDIADVLGMRTT